MGFLVGRLQREHNPTKGLSLELLHRHECAVCPLDRAKDLRHPKMLPNGSKRPVIYMLGEAPGATEDEDGEAFVGKSGQVLRRQIPDAWLDDLRWSNTIRCRPAVKDKKGGYITNREPTPVEIECCRPRLVHDIEASKPEAIFGFGNLPLSWLIGEAGVSKWRGKRMPVQIGSHRCWYYAHYHPSHVMRAREEEGNRKGRDLEFVFGLDLDRAFRDVEEGLPEPVIHTAEFARQDIETITGEHGDADLDRALDLMERIASEEVAGLDFETKRTRPYRDDAKLLTFAISGAEKAVAIAVDHREAGWRPQQRTKLMEGLSRFLYEAKARKVVHHLAYELEWAAFMFGYEVVHAGRYGDTISQAFVLDERQGALSLEFLCWQNFGLNIKTLGRPLDKNNLDEEPLADVLTYNAIDAKYHRLLYAPQKIALQADGVMEVYAHHLRRVQATVLTQLKGVPVDQKQVVEFYRLYSDQLADVEERIYAHTDVEAFHKLTTKEFRPSAPADLKLLLIKVCGIYDLKSTDEDDLKKIDEPIIALILEWRGIAKLLSTYVKPLLSAASAEAEGFKEFDAAESVVFPDGLLHPIISTIKTRTWRTASEEPNCFPGYVEVLTSAGWQRWQDVDDDAVLAQYDVDAQTIDFIKPERFIRQSYVGDLIRLRTELHFDVPCTPNHRFVLVNRHSGSKHWCRADEFKSDYLLPQAGSYVSGSTLLRPSQVILIAAFQADAYWSKSDGYVEWCFAYQRKQDRLRQALQAEGIEFNERPRHPCRNDLAFYVARRDLPEWLTERRHYGPWLLELDQTTLKLLADEVWQWDGSATTQTDFCTGNKIDADWVQILLTLAGRRAAVRHRASTSVNTLFVSVGSKPYSHTSNFTAAREKFDGTVYCVTMPKGTVIVRHNGLVAITGQSQNFPKRENREIRKQVRHPDQTMKVVSFDYAGIQARNIAMESLDKSLVDSFWHRYDIHGDWLERIARRAPEFVKEGVKALANDKELFKKYRHLSKNKFVFPSFFGAQPPNVANGLNISEGKAADLQDELWDMFPEVRDWQKGVIAGYNKLGYVTGLSGFRRHAPVSITELINAPIQADEAIIVLTAMAELCEMGDPRFHPNMEIHDDLTFFWLKGEIERNAETVIDTMLNTPYDWAHSVPIGIEMAVGDDWNDQKGVGEYFSDLWSGALREKAA